MTKEELKTIEENIQSIILNARATFFVKDKNVEIDNQELFDELKADISTKVSFYLFNLIN